MILIFQNSVSRAVVSVVMGSIGVTGSGFFGKAMSDFCGKNWASIFYPDQTEPSDALNLIQKHADVGYIQTDHTYARITFAERVFLEP